MGIFSKKLFNPETRKIPGPLDDYWYHPYGATQTTTAGVKVDEKTAVKYLTVAACVSLIAGDVANLPLILYKRIPGGKERAIDHPKYDLCHATVNEEITSRNWIETELTHLLLWGNSFSLKIFNKMGKLIQLWPISNPGAVEVEREKDGKLHYKWRTTSGIEINKTRDEILHIPGWGFDGLVGMSPIAIAREAIGLGLAAEEFGERFFGHGTHPAGMITMPPEAEGMDEETQKAYKTNFIEQYSGVGRTHTMMLMMNGEKYTPFTMPLNDAQFLESRQFQKLEIAGMYHVPPHKIAVHGANSNYNNEEQENRHYVDSCLMSWLRRLETSKNQQILDQKERLDGYFYEFLVDGLLRGDSAARVAYYTGMKNIGAITNNEIRAKENMNPLDKDQRGDETTMPLNFIFVKDAGIIPDNGMGKENGKENEREWAKRVLQTKEHRSITARDRIAKNYRPLLFDSAQQVVSRETRAIKAQVQKLRMRRSSQKLDEWLDEYYQGLADYIRTKLGPTMASFAQAIVDATVDELGGKDFDQAEIDKFVDDYIATYVIRHVSSSQGQIKALTELDEIDERMDEWYEKRAEKIANNETVRLSNGVFQAVAFTAGFVTVFRNRGPSTCPYCKSLEGTKVSIGKYLVSDGDEIKPSGQEPMKIRGSKAHPPIHRGCLPWYSTVSAFDITASSERWYDGDLFVINTATGQQVTCTPNHPIFSGHEWIPACEFNEGDQIGYRGAIDFDTPVVGNGNNMPAFIKDIAKSFIDSSKMIAIPVPVSTEDFYSDTSDSEITIIRTDGSLLFEINPALFHQLSEFNFILGDRGKCSFSTHSGFTEFIKSNYPAQSGPVCSFDLFLSLFRAHFSSDKFSGLTTPSDFDAIFNKVVINNFSGNTESFGNTQNGFTTDILVDEVIRVEKNSFHGLVYNLHTNSNVFYSDKLLIHNCDCYMAIG